MFTFAPVILMVNGEKIRWRSLFMKESALSSQEGKDEEDHPHIFQSGQGEGVHTVPNNVHG